MIYLAAPFSHPDSEMRRWRHEAVCRAAAELIRAGRTVFSPISHSYGISRYGLPLNWEFWRRLDLKYLELCDEVMVLKLPGWQASVGVQSEIAIARELGKPVTFMETPAEQVANIAFCPVEIAEEEGRSA